jgi:hypothetical protein
MSKIDFRKKVFPKKTSFFHFKPSCRELLSIGKIIVTEKFLSISKKQFRGFFVIIYIYEK